MSVIPHTFNTNTGINMFLNAGEKITHLMTERTVFLIVVLNVIMLLRQLEVFIFPVKLCKYRK